MNRGFANLLVAVTAGLGVVAHTAIAQSAAGQSPNHVGTKLLLIHDDYLDGPKDPLHECVAKTAAEYEKRGVEVQSMSRSEFIRISGTRGRRRDRSLAGLSALEVAKQANSEIVAQFSRSTRLAATSASPPVPQVDVQVYFRPLCLALELDYSPPLELLPARAVDLASLVRFPVPLRVEPFTVPSYFEQRSLKSLPLLPPSNGFLGIGFEPIPSPSGPNKIKITKVCSASPAECAHLRVGDVVTRIKGSTDVLSRLRSINDTPPGTELRIELERGGDRLTKRIALTCEYKYLARIRAAAIRKWWDRPLGEFSDGSDARLSTYKGKPMILFIWATFCGPCKPIFATLQMIAEQYQDAPIPIICISVDDDPQTWMNYVAHNALPGQHYLSREFASELTVAHLPTIIVVSPELEVTPELDPHFLPWVIARSYQRTMRPG